MVIDKSKLVTLESLKEVFSSDIMLNAMFDTDIVTPISDSDNVLYIASDESIYIF